MPYLLYCVFSNNNIIKHNISKFGKLCTVNFDANGTPHTNALINIIIIININKLYHLRLKIKSLRIEQITINAHEYYSRAALALKKNLHPATQECAIIACTMYHQQPQPQTCMQLNTSYRANSPLSSSDRRNITSPGLVASMFPSRPKQLSCLVSSRVNNMPHALLRTLSSLHMYVTTFTRFAQ